MKAGYKILFPRAAFDDPLLVDAQIERIANDMTLVADGIHPRTHEVVPGTTEVRYMAWRAPRFDDFGATVELERAQLWDREVPLPEWAEGAFVTVVVEVREKSEG